MKPNARQLAMRDPALAALLGVVGSSNSDFGADFGDDMGDDYGADFGADFGAAALATTAPANAAEMQTAWQQYQASKASAVHTKNRSMLLEPNKGSAVKIERYSFSINDTMTLGTVKTLDLTGQPDTNIRPQRVTMNAPAPGFVIVNEIKVANVSVTVGGSEDAFDYSAQAVGSHLDMPTLSPANRATVLAGYTGFVPPGYVSGSNYLFAVSFKGPASIVA